MIQAWITALFEAVGSVISGIGTNLESVVGMFYKENTLTGLGSITLVGLAVGLGFMLFNKIIGMLKGLK